VAAGLTVWQTCALSLLLFSGGSQFAFIGIIAAGGAGASAFGASTLLGIRNGLYGLQVKSLLRPTHAITPLMAQLTIDESMANSSAWDEPDEQRRGFWTAGVGVYLCWNALTLVGALVGQALGDTKAWGLDGAACAAFLGLLWPRLKGRDLIAIAVASAALTLLVTPFTPPGIPILVAGGVVALVTWWRTRRAA